MAAISSFDTQRCLSRRVIVLWTKLTPLVLESVTAICGDNEAPTIHDNSSLACHGSLPCAFNVGWMPTKTSTSDDRNRYNTQDHGTSPLNRIGTVVAKRS